MICRSTAICLLGIFLILSLSNIYVRGDDQTIVGFVLDGPWERNGEVRRLLERKIAARLGQTKVSFPSSKRLSGNWTRASTAGALDQLLGDPEVDLVVTLGLLSSHEAVSRTSLAKPVVAARVASSQLLRVPSRGSAAERISGVQNLTYITLGDLDLNRSIKQFQKLKRFRKITFLTSEAFRDLSPDLEQLLQNELARAGVQQTQVIFVRSSIATTIASLSRESEAVVVTFLPQLDPEDYSTLLGALGTMRLPVFSVGGRTLVQLGALAGWGPADETDKIAERVASNVQRIVNGEKAETLPVELNIQPQLAINMETAGRFGISPQAGWQDAMLVLETIGAGASAPSMTGLTYPTGPAAQSPRPQPSPTVVRRTQAQILADIRRRIFQLRDFSAFDVLNPKVVSDGNVILLGYAFKPKLKSEAERVVRGIQGVKSVDNRIELLPSSQKDDRIRVRVFRAVYGHPSLQSYVPKGSLEGGAVGVDKKSLPRGPHPILILVRNGNVALIGQVSSNTDRKAAEKQASSVSGIVSLENYLRVG